MLEGVQKSSHRKMFRQFIAIISIGYNIHSLAQLLLPSVICALYFEVSMDILEGRSELKRMSRGSFFTLVATRGYPTA